MGPGHSTLLAFTLCNATRFEPRRRSARSTFAAPNQKNTTGSCQLDGTLKAARLLSGHNKFVASARFRVRDSCGGVFYGWGCGCGRRGRALACTSLTRRCASSWERPVRVCQFSRSEGPRGGVIQQQSYGSILLAIIAAGPFAFGVYELAEGDFGSITAPSVRQAAANTGLARLRSFPATRRARMRVR